MRLLIADDNDDIRLLLRSLTARDDGIAVVAEARDGNGAIVSAHDRRPDVVLLDVVMDGMDGLTALPRIKDVAPACRIVMYSAHEEHRDRCLSAGADAWVDKSAPWSEIREAIVGADDGGDRADGSASP